MLAIVVQVRTHVVVAADGRGGIIVDTVIEVELGPATHELNRGSILSAPQPGLNDNLHQHLKNTVSIRQKDKYTRHSQYTGAGIFTDRVERA